jgi:hypothetical protein
MKSAYEYGYDARVRGCFRVLANPASREQLLEWQRGWDDADRFTTEGMVWWNGLSEQERLEWLELAAGNASAADAYREYVKSAAVHRLGAQR